jgi:hypothetical protein
MFLLSVAEIFLLLIILAGIFFVLKPLQKKIEKILRKLLTHKTKESEIIDVTPSKSNNKES